MSAKTKRSSWTQGQFVRFELGKEHAQMLKKAKNDLPEMCSFIGKCIDCGYKFSTRYDQYGDCVAVWMQPDGTMEENKDLILSGRGRTFEGAMAEVLVKHLVLNGEWPRPEKKESVETWEEWGKA